MLTRLHSFSYALPCLLLCACPTVNGGDSLGLPIYHNEMAPVLTGVKIRQVALDPTALQLQLVNESITSLDLQKTPLHLLLDGGSVDLSQGAITLLAPNQVIMLQVPELAQMHFSAGELLLMDASDNPQDYVVWGSAPQNFPRSLAPMARTGGLAVDESYLPVPFSAAPPYPVLVHDSNGISGCLDGNDVVACAANPNLGVQITAVTPSIGQASSTLQLTNNQNVATQLYGLIFCRQSVCRMWDVSDPNYQLAAHSSQTFAIGDNTDPNVLMLPLPYVAPGRGSLSANEELALLPPGPQPTDPNAQVWSYLRYGATAAQGLAPVAERANLWSAQDAPLPANAQSYALAPALYGQNASAAGWATSP